MGTLRRYIGWRCASLEELQTLNARSVFGQSLADVVVTIPGVGEFVYENGVWTSIGSGGDGLTKKYVALLTQTSTNAPVATVLQNDLGGTVVWARNNTGNYSATLAGVFTSNKTTFFFSTLASSSLHVYATRTSDNEVTVTTFGTAADEDNPADDILSNTDMEITVYP